MDEVDTLADDILRTVETLVEVATLLDDDGLMEVETFFDEVLTEYVLKRRVGDDLILEDDSFTDDVSGVLFLILVSD